MHTLKEMKCEQIWFKSHLASTKLMILKTLTIYYQILSITAEIQKFLEYKYELRNNKNKRDDS